MTIVLAIAAFILGAVIALLAPFGRKIVSQREREDWLIIMGICVLFELILLTALIYTL